ncbi:hypothetical protein ACYFX5_03735 [Bremerella sp. T1]|uniref:hypothetical protein n=1 Tax=Bremerella sp. TYQ1 TaxID=3119568 RepID=UPI001CCB1F39|nr:hypothetical protein [Bremerella volcania]UBM37383.1 hypothetical protein LA756_05690 [Bremerella volcania]
MIRATKDSTKLHKLATTSDKWEEEFPRVQLVPGLEGYLDARSWLSGSDIDDEDDEIIPNTQGHVHSFHYEFKNDEHGYLHVWICDLDGPPLTEAVSAFQRIVSELNEMIEQLINLPAENYPYPPKGWDNDAIAKNMEAWHEATSGTCRNFRYICEGISTSERPKDYAVDKAGSPIDDTRGHVHEVTMTIPEVDMHYYRASFDDRNGSMEDQTANHLRGMIQALESKLAEVEAAKLQPTSSRT